MIIIDLFIILCGLLLGSYIYNQALRLHRDESSWGFSCCDHCKRPVGIIGLIPILGYLIQKGKCRYCKKKVSVTYPLMEAFNALLIYLIYLKIGLTIELIPVTLLFEALFLVAILDFKSYLIYPHPIIFALIVQTSWLFGWRKELLPDSFAGLFIGAGIFHFISYLYQVIRKRNGLGEGDATLLGVIGYILGWRYLLPVIFLSSFLGIIGGSITLILQKKTISKEIAFGPWLVLGAFISWYFPSMINIFQNFN